MLSKPSSIDIKFIPVNCDVKERMLLYTYNRKIHSKSNKSITGSEVKFLTTWG